MDRFDFVKKFASAKQRAKTIKELKRLFIQLKTKVGASELKLGKELARERARLEVAEIRNKRKSPKFNKEFEKRMYRLEQEAFERHMDKLQGKAIRGGYTAGKESAKSPPYGLSPYRDVIPARGGPKKTEFQPAAGDPANMRTFLDEVRKLRVEKGLDKSMSDQVQLNKRLGYGEFIPDVKKIENEAINLQRVRNKYKRSKVDKGGIDIQLRTGAAPTKRGPVNLTGWEGEYSLARDLKETAGDITGQLGSELKKAKEDSDLFMKQLLKRNKK